VEPYGPAGSPTWRQRRGVSRPQADLPSGRAGIGGTLAAMASSPAVSPAGPGLGAPAQESLPGRFAGVALAPGVRFAWGEEGAWRREVPQGGWTPLHRDSPALDGSVSRGVLALLMDSGVLRFDARSGRRLAELAGGPFAEGSRVIAVQGPSPLGAVALDTEGRCWAATTDGERLHALAVEIGSATALAVDRAGQGYVAGDGRISPIGADLPLDVKLEGPDPVFLSVAGQGRTPAFAAFDAKGYGTIALDEARLELALDAVLGSVDFVQVGREELWVLATVDDATGLRLWRVARQGVREIPLPDDLAAPTRFASFGPDDQSLVLLDRDGTTLTHLRVDLAELASSVADPAPKAPAGAAAADEPPEAARPDLTPVDSDTAEPGAPDTAETDVAEAAVPESAVPEAESSETGSAPPEETADEPGQREAPGLRIAFQAVSDRPITDASEDLLDRAGIADALVDFVLDESGGTPLSLAIDAPWGQGKTSLMQMMSSELEAHGFVTVHFNAWLYDDPEQIGSALAEALLARVRELPVDDWLATRTRIAWLRTDWAGFRRWSLFGAAAAGGLSVIPAVGLFDTISSTTIGGGGAFGAWLWGTWKSAAGNLGAFRLKLRRAFRTKRYDARLPFLDSLRTDFQQVLAAMAETQRRRVERTQLLEGARARWDLERTVVFVDDLDRCSPSSIATVIEAMNLLLGAEHTVFVLGMDMEMIRAALEVENEGLASQLLAHSGEKRSRFGQRFLEKIVQVHYRIPPGDADGSRVRRLVGGGGTDEPAPEPPPSPDEAAAGDEPGVDLQGSLDGTEGAGAPPEPAAAGRPPVPDEDAVAAIAQMQAKTANVGAIGASVEEALRKLQDVSEPVRAGSTGASSARSPRASTPPTTRSCSG